MAGPRVAQGEVRQVLVGFAAVVCGWWLARSALLLIALKGRRPLPEAFWWVTVALATTTVLSAVGAVLAARGLLRGSRLAWWVGLGLLVLMVADGVTLLRVPGLGAAVVLVGVVGLGLLLGGRSRLQSFVAVPVEDAAGGMSTVWRRAGLAACTSALVAWYVITGVNALIGAGKIRVVDHPPCDSSAAYTSHTEDLARWMLEEGKARQLPIDGVSTAVCSPGSWTPGVASGEINAGGAPVVRARLEQFGCVWHDNYCPVMLDQIHAKARLHDGPHPTVELWPAQ